MALTILCDIVFFAWGTQLMIASFQRPHEWENAFKQAATPIQGITMLIGTMLSEAGATYMVHDLSKLF